MAAFSLNWLLARLANQALEMDGKSSATGEAMKSSGELTSSQPIADAETSLQRRNSSSLESFKICTLNVSKSLKVLGCLLILSISPAGSS